MDGFMMMVFVLLYILCISHNITPAQRPEQSKQFYSCQSMTQVVPGQTTPASSSSLFDDDNDNSQMFVGMKHFSPVRAILPLLSPATIRPDEVFSEETLDDPQKLAMLFRRGESKPLTPLAPTEPSHPARRPQAPVTPSPKSIKPNKSSDEFVVVNENIGNLIRERLTEKNPSIRIPTIQYLRSMLNHTPVLESMTQEHFMEFLPLIKLFLLHNDQDYTDLNADSLPEKDFQKFLDVLYNNDSITQALRAKEISLIQQWKQNKHPFMSMQHMKLTSKVQHAQNTLADTVSSVYTVLAKLVRK